MLLFAYAEDDEPPKVVDFASGESAPEHIIQALFDPEVEKRAYNAAFEWACLTRHYNNRLAGALTAEAWLDQWCCTQLQSLFADTRTRCRTPAARSDCRTTNRRAKQAGRS